MRLGPLEKSLLKVPDGIGFRVSVAAGVSSLRLTLELGSGPIDFRLAAWFTARKTSGKHV